MSQISISITKQTAFRDSVQEFSNVYSYTSNLALPSVADALALIDEIVVVEKLLHSTSVTFVQGRCWSSGGSISQNQMIAQKALSGAGSLTENASLDRERAFLVQWPAGFDSRGHPVKLKKWYHSCGAPVGVTIAATQLANVAGFSSGSRTAYSNIVSQLSGIGSGDPWQLCAPSGRLTTAGPEAHQYLEHHQLGDQWRA